MTLNEFIAELQKLESSGYGDLPVCLADWQECYLQPNVEAVQVSFEKNGKFRTSGYATGWDTEGDFIKIGE